MRFLSLACACLALAADPNPEPEPKKETREELLKRLVALPATAVKAAKTDRELVDLLFKGVVNRLPDDKQRKMAEDYLAKTKDRVRFSRDVVWALVNTKEFIKLHKIPVGEEAISFIQKLTTELEKDRK